MLRTGLDGRFSGTIPTRDDSAVISFEKEGYGAHSTIAPPGREFTVNRKVDWEEALYAPLPA